MLGVTLEVGIETTMGFNRDDWSEVEFSSLKLRFTSTMGAVRQGRW